MELAPITSPDSPALAQLCAQLAEQASEVDATGEWPQQSLRLCGDAGVFRWFVDHEHGGLAWNSEQVVRGYLALASACLTTTFVITQRTGACRRIAEGTNAALKQRLLPPLASGQMHATVAVSHLTTSHRHQGQPVLTALRTSGGWRLDGFSPWSTGADHADVIVTGADVVEHDQPTGQQILIAVPANQPGVSTPPAPRFVALSAAHTGRVEYDGVELDDSWLVQGPVENVMTAGKSTKPGGHETSTLALGVAQAAIDFLHHESQARDDLRAARKALAAEHADLFASLLALSRGEPACSTQQVRSRANSLVLRASQAALAAAKGTGYVEGHPAGRWCREALFFLVWSCPQPVMNANLCELAGIAE